MTFYKTSAELAGHLLAKVLGREAALAGGGRHVAQAVPHAQLQAEHQVVAAVALVDRLALPVGCLPCAQRSDDLAFVHSSVDSKEGAPTQVSSCCVAPGGACIRQPSCHKCLQRLWCAMSTITRTCAPAAAAGCGMRGAGGPNAAMMP